MWQGYYSPFRDEAERRDVAQGHKVLSGCAAVQTKRAWNLVNQAKSHLKRAQSGTSLFRLLTHLSCEYCPRMKPGK